MERAQQIAEVRNQLDGIFSKLRQEFDEGPDQGVQLAPGEGAMLFRILSEAGIVRR